MKNHKRKHAQKRAEKQAVSKSVFHRSVPWILFGVIILFALLLRLSGIWRANPIDYHPDEWVLAKPIMSLANDAETSFKNHYKWPGCGVIYLVGYILYFLKGIFGPYSYNCILIILRVISALASTGTVVALFILTKKMFSLRTAMFAATFLAIAKLPVVNGHYGTVSSIVSLIILVVMYLSFNLFETDSDCAKNKLKTGRCILLGCICGWGIASKWTILLAAIPVFGAFLLTVWSTRKTIVWKVFLKINFTRTIIILAVTAIIFLVAIPDFQLNPKKVIEGFQYEMKHNKTGHYGEISSDQNALSKKLHRTYKKLGQCGNTYFLIAGIVALVFCFITINRQKAFLLWTVLLWLLVLIRNLLAFERHHLVPFIIMLSLIAVMLEVGTFSLRRWIRLPCWMIFIFLTLSGLLYTCITISPFWKPDGRVECAKWIMENVPPGSGVTWAPRTSDWTVPGTRIMPELFKKFPRHPKPGQYQYIIAAQNKLSTFRKHPPSRKIVPDEWFPAKPPSMMDLQLYAEMNAGGGPNLSKVKGFYVKPSFLGLNMRLFGQHSGATATFANRNVVLYKFNKPRQK